MHLKICDTCFSKIQRFRPLLLLLAVPEMDAFMPLEPLDNDYNFSLDHTEGVFELFDFNFQFKVYTRDGEREDAKICVYTTSFIYANARLYFYFHYFYCKFSKFRFVFFFFFFWRHERPLLLRCSSSLPFFSFRIECSDW